METLSFDRCGVGSIPGLGAYSVNNIHRGVRDSGVNPESCGQSHSIQIKRADRA